MDQYGLQQIFMRVIEKSYVSVNRDVAYIIQLDTEYARNVFAVNKVCVHESSSEVRYEKR